MKRLRTMVEASKLSSRELAARVGAYQTQVMRVLHGDSKLDVADFITWCEACGKNPAVEIRSLAAEIKQAERR